MPGMFISMIVFASWANEHDYWLAPNKFFYSIREVAVVSVQSGDRFTVSQRETDNRIRGRFLHYKPSGDINNLHELISENADTAQVPLKEEGTHMIVFNSNRNEMQPEAAEPFQLCSKTIFQSGGQAKLGNACTMPTDLPLDIIPSENPYALPDPGFKTGSIKVRFRVLFKREPVQNAWVKVWHFVKGKGIQADSALTNNRGYIVTGRHPGPNLVTCEYRETTADGTQNFRGSLSFDYSQFFPRKSNP